MSKWWQKSVVYQIYPRSFMDSNGDGIGDIRGVISKLDYLEYLGIDVIWLSPVYQSPNDDNGYDISDYREIHYEFGSMNDMEELIEEASKRGIRIVMDLVANHTSDEHPWFIEAKNKESVYRDYYIWRDPKVGDVPNDFKSTFSGSAWELDESGQYYLHIFSKKQPDLNWENPMVRKEIWDIINFWIDKGVGGFRMDVIELIGKIPDEKIIDNGPKLHDYIKEMNKNSFGNHDLLTVGECWGASPEIAKQYSDPNDSELSMVFQFEHVLLDQQPGKEKWDIKPLELKALKSVFSKWQKALYQKGWNSLFWNNHDLPRIVSRWGNDKAYRVESAKMLAILLHMQQGTPYIYQGEEIGMTNVRFQSIDEYKDIETLNMYRERINQGYSEAEIMTSINVKGRDNARTPMQWNQELNAGFSTGSPWINVNENYESINVHEAIKNKNSILQTYRELIKLRRDSEISELLIHGEFKMIFEDHPRIFAYERCYNNEGIRVICNFYNQNEVIDLEVDADQMLVTNYNDLQYDLGKLKLRPYEAFVVKYNE